MSYLIENSIVVTKIQYNENEEQYYAFEKYELENSYLLTQNDKPFFSIYDIAYRCKKLYKEDKLFIIVHRYYDKVQEQTVTEFYIFNTIDIFEQSLTSFLTVDNYELIDKQHVIQDNIELAMKLLNIENIHIILGDNVKMHEVVEYLNIKTNNIDIEIFNSEIKYNSLILSEHEKDNLTKFVLPENINTTRISSLLKSIRVIESNSVKIKKYFIFSIILLLSFYLSGDFIDSYFDDTKKDIKKESKVLKNKL
jgi:hypothetical protein